ncbi:GNAT family N-acetyltransferase [Acetatifactor muris]|uniref:TDP-4-oxo-6-deoxy-alpha-D-glucose-3, 4-oxoisomerase n=1 Tax=Acetatifactor muris TaxID=879566 RepID=A0A2K4ZDA2_9FIRM|nr:GNAT family N-acetyltransferase [Acetatifactor muris]MCR2046971.1 GNAT family N-acetyltransferase [Acetatifactor muris]SOY28438.1 TDP-4-oxo-6-deoxy-alpha-D-glucose-3, 4-oxoisomerase [Acetatifactor muris]
MRLRRLELKDAPLMLEWMHDKDVVKDLNTDFASKSLDDCVAFIKSSLNDEKNLHLSITDDADAYMGTASLKHIADGTAELAIVVREEAMRRGYAWFGMEEILKKAFEELNLESVYWCVSRLNHRAVRFYDKHNFHEVKDVPAVALERYLECADLKWYSVLRGDDINIRDKVAGCRVIHIKTIPTVNAGELSYFEATHEIPFDIKRIYYISKVPEGTRRGFHAHKELKQVLFCPYGRIQLVLENKNGREEIELSDPSIGVVIEECTWREMLWLQKDSVLCVAASDFYKTEDYIRDYDEFNEIVRKSHD